MTKPVDRRMSDEELRTTELETEDPTAQLGLVDKIPPGVTLEKVLNVYRIPGYPKVKGFCAYCQSHLHQKGFTGVLSDGALVMLGSKCGCDAFGEDWKTAAARLEGDVERKRVLLTTDIWRKRLPDIRIAALRWSRIINRVLREIERVRREYPDLHAALVKAARHQNGELRIEEKVRDYAAEQRRASRGSDEDDGQKDEPIFASVEKVLWQLRGRPVFQADSVHTTQTRAGALLLDADSIINDTAGRSTSKISKAIADIDRARQALVEMERMARALPEFYEPANLRNIAQWATRSDAVGGAWKYEKGGLHREGSDVAIGPLTDYELPAGSLTELFDVQKAA